MFRNRAKPKLALLASTSLIPSVSTLTPSFSIQANSALLWRSAATQPATKYSRFRYPAIENKLESAYNKIKLVMLDELKVATSQNKKLLVVAGEQHTKKECLLMEVMLLSIASQQNIKHVFVELSPVWVSSYLKTRHVGRRGNQFAPDLNMLESYLVTSQQSSMSVLGIESPMLDVFRANETTTRLLANQFIVSWRENYMAKQMIKANQHGVAIVGAGHLKGMMENPILRHHYHAIAINLSGDHSHVMPFLNDYQKECIRYAEEPQNALQLLPILTLFGSRKESAQQVLTFCTKKAQTTLDLEHVTHPAKASPSSH